MKESLGNADYANGSASSMLMREQLARGNPSQVDVHPDGTAQQPASPRPTSSKLGGLKRTGGAGRSQTDSNLQEKEVNAKTKGRSRRTRGKEMEKLVEAKVRVGSLRKRLAIYWILKEPEELAQLHGLAKTLRSSVGQLPEEVQKALEQIESSSSKEATKTYMQESCEHQHMDGCHKELKQARPIYLGDLSQFLGEAGSSQAFEAGAAAYEKRRRSLKKDGDGWYCPEIVREVAETALPEKTPVRRSLYILSCQTWMSGIGRPAYSEPCIDVIMVHTANLTDKIYMPRALMPMNTAAIRSPKTDIPFNIIALRQVFSWNKRC